MFITEYIPLSAERRSHGSKRTYPLVVSGLARITGKKKEVGKPRQRGNTVNKIYFFTSNI